MRLRAAILSVLAAAVLTLATQAQEAKPRVPPGRDPGGVAIALISTGIDYTIPEIAQRLARDGEGELIGWDLEDKDRRPFDKSKGGTAAEWGGDATLIASLVLGPRTSRLVPVRADPREPASLARAIAFVAQTPARIAVLPMWSTAKDNWEPLRQAAERFKEVLIIVPAGQGGQAVYPAAFGLDNVLAVEQGPGSVEAIGFGGRTWRISGAGPAVAAVAAAAAELLAREPTLGAVTLRRRLVETGSGPMWRMPR
jgi:hypothetical protein